jgi:DNA-directed RNA polymerase subunit RPC12/RpoP
MTFPLTCLACGHVDHVEWSQIGQKIACGGCARTATVPAPMETVGEPVVQALNLKFRCPSCGRKFATKPELAGKKIRCTSCGAGVRVPAGEANFVANSAQAPTNSFGGVDASASPPRSDRDLPVRADVSAWADDEEADSEPLEVDLAKILESKRPRRASTVLPSRAELMEQVLQQVAEQAVVETKQKAEKTAKKKKRKKKKSSSFFDPKETLKLVAGVSVVVGLVAFFAWGYPDLRFPLGGLLCVIGFIVYLLGAVSIRQVVAEEGVLKAFVFRFCPPYQWWFVTTHWEETKDFVAFFVAGLVIMAIGSGVIKTSAVGKQAEASERAYQKAVKARQSEIPPLSPKAIPGDDD